MSSGKLGTSLGTLTEEVRPGKRRCYANKGQGTTFAKKGNSDRGGHMLMRELRPPRTAPRALGWWVVWGRGYANKHSHSFGRQVGKLTRGGAMQMKNCTTASQGTLREALVLVGGTHRLTRGRI